MPFRNIKPRSTRLQTSHSSSPLTSQRCCLQIVPGLPYCRGTESLLVGIGYLQQHFQEGSDIATPTKVWDPLLCTFSISASPCFHLGSGDQFDVPQRSLLNCWLKYSELEITATFLSFSGGPLVSSCQKEDSRVRTKSSWTAVSHKVNILTSLQK